MIGLLCYTSVKQGTNIKTMCTTYRNYSNLETQTHIY